MKTLPVRVWLWLLLGTVVAVPAFVTMALATVHPPPPPSPANVVDSRDATVRTDIVAQVGQWSEPRWQAQIAPRLAAAGVAATFIDGSGQVVFRSSTWPVPGDAGTESTPPQPPRLTSLIAPDAGGTAVAVLAVATQDDSGPRRDPPWFNTDFWRIPIAQMAALLLIVAAIALGVQRAFLHPLARMVEAMRHVGTGDLDVRLPGSRVTEVDEVATAFGTMAEALRRSLERQEALEQERRMTISAVVHDLRTPLFSLRGYLEGLATGVADSPEKVDRYVRVAREKADALDRLVSDLFAYTRTEYLEEVPRPEVLELGELLRRTVEGLQPQAAAKGVRLVLGDPGLRVMVAGDPMLLTRAVENVLDNAIRHTPSGGEICVVWQQHPMGATFIITDTGPGLSVADLPHLFTPLYRGEASRNRRTGGAGPGLAIARRLLRAHGGDLTAGNAATGGALFTGSLPALPGSLHIAANGARQEIVTAPQWENSRLERSISDGTSP